MVKVGRYVIVRATFEVNGRGPGRLVGRLRLD